MSGHHVDIWSEKEVVSYLNDLIQKGSVKKCSKLKLEQGYLNAYYPRCAGGYASREVAHNVETSPKGDSAPRHYAWPVCPEACPFFEEITDFPSNLLAKRAEERIIDKEALAIPEKETSVIPEIADVSRTQRSDEKPTLEPEKVLKEVDETIQGIDQTTSVAQIGKLERLLGKQIKERIIDKEPLAIPEKETLVIPEIADVSTIQRSDEKTSLEQGKALKEVDERVQGIDQTKSEMQVRKLKRLLGKQIEERTIDKEPLAIPEKETLVIPEIADVSITQQSDENAGLGPEKVLKEVDETIQGIDQTTSEAQIRKLKRLSQKKGLPVSEPMRDIMSGHHVDIWSEKEVVSYLNDLIQKGSVKKCSKLKLEQGYLNAYYPRCAGDYASREVAHNVETSPRGDSAPRHYAWPVCPEACPFFEEITDFSSGLLTKQTEERIIDKEPLAIPAVAEVSIIQKHEEKKILEPQKILRSDDEITRRVDEHISEVQIKKLKKLSRKTGLPVSEHIQRAIDEYLSKQETGNK